ncbi:hypothetical protein AGDE_03108 [Angomonas deanei]|nr:hypothetical protein AGDE_03108 [Angomonas deanei]|eukprot:EPY40818.1 hypothetical protein AGDE_03108 [Angomonas deanei]
MTRRHLSRRNRFHILGCISHTVNVLVRFASVEVIRVNHAVLYVHLEVLQAEALIVRPSAHGHQRPFHRDTLRLARLHVLDGVLYHGLLRDGVLHVVHVEQLGEAVDGHAAGHQSIVNGIGEVLVLTRENTLVLVHEEHLNGAHIRKHGRELAPHRARTDNHDTLREWHLEDIIRVADQLVVAGVEWVLTRDGAGGDEEVIRGDGVVLSFTSVHVYLPFILKRRLSVNDFDPRCLDELIDLAFTHLAGLPHGVHDFGVIDVSFHFFGQGGVHKPARQGWASHVGNGLGNLPQRLGGECATPQVRAAQSVARLHEAHFFAEGDGSHRACDTRRSGADNTYIKVRVLVHTPQNGDWAIKSQRCPPHYFVYENMKRKKQNELGAPEGRKREKRKIYRDLKKK